MARSWQSLDAITTVRFTVLVCGLDTSELKESMIPSIASLSDDNRLAGWCQPSSSFPDFAVLRFGPMEYNIPVHTHCTVLSVAEGLFILCSLSILMLMFGSFDRFMSSRAVAGLYSRRARLHRLKSKH